MIVRNQYSRRRTQSLREAMAQAITQHLLEAKFYTPDGSMIQLAKVYPDWPDSEDHFVTPSAVVLPGPGTYEDAGMTPTLIRETWEPEGQPGLGLYKLSELVVPYEIQIRAPTAVERDIIMGGIEELWVAPGVLMDHDAGAHYGVFLEMPEYWGIQAAFSLESMRTLDDEDHALRNHREAVFSVMGWAPHVVLDSVQPCKLTVTLDV